MTQVTHSMTLVAAEADRDAANAYFEGLGWGNPILTVPLSADGQLPVTHYGAHDMRTAEVVATLLAAKESDDPTLDGLDPVFIYPVESETQQFDVALASSECVTAFGTTLQRYYPPVDV
jgi:hypothetical protein